MELTLVEQALPLIPPPAWKGVPTPKNLLELAGLKMGPRQTAIVEEILKGRTDLTTNLVELSESWKIRVWFANPVEIRTGRRYGQTKYKQEHVFARFFISSRDQLCYALSRSHRTGYHLGDRINKIVKYEPVLDTYDGGAGSDHFTSYEQFKKKFDLFFITEAEVRKLWDGTSAQHGGKYLKSDFRRLGRQGKWVMEQFLRFFKGISNGGNIPGYCLETDGKYFYTRADYTSMSNRQYFGRDIHMTHQTNLDWVYYASEFPGCGNGRYGLIANKHEFLHLEDD
jgi:hypothetical protein